MLLLFEIMHIFVPAPVRNNEYFCVN